MKSIHCTAEYSQKQDHVLDLSADAHEMVNKTIIIMPAQAFGQQLELFHSEENEQAKNPRNHTHPQSPP